jgi:hypothetical protein
MNTDTRIKKLLEAPAATLRAIDELLENPTAPAAPLERLLTRREVAKLANRTPRAVDHWSRRGLLPRIALPGCKRGIGFRRADVERILGGRGEEES